jgi:hypothetical protein
VFVVSEDQWRSGAARRFVRARQLGGVYRWEQTLLTPPGVDVTFRLQLDQVAFSGPCLIHCGECSRCIRAAWIERHGGDHFGGPVEWEPGERKANG